VEGVRTKNKCRRKLKKLLSSFLFELPLKHLSIRKQTKINRLPSTGDAEREPPFAGLSRHHHFHQKTDLRLACSV
jgi:hypothetical protein